MQPSTLKFWRYSPVVKPIYKDKFCHRPFTTLVIDEDGDVMLCGCPSHMPYVIGNVYQDTLYNIWNNSQAHMVRQSVTDGDFTYCSWNCTSLVNLPKRTSLVPQVRDFPSVIQINLDQSCNLKCPSCREHVIIEKNNDRIQKQIKLFNELVTWAKENPNRVLKLTPVGVGDIFASHSGLKFLESLQDYPHNNLKLHITTNGTLIKKNQQTLQKIKPMLEEFSVSIDAATAETYALVRGGNWQDLLDGLKIINDFGIRPSVRFVVQQNNYHEIEKFAELVNQFRITSIYYANLEDWGHWTIQWWRDNNVLDRHKDSFEQVLETLDSVTKRYPNQIVFSAVIKKYLTKKDVDKSQITVV